MVLLVVAVVILRSFGGTETVKPIHDILDFVLNYYNDKCKRIEMAHI